MNNGSVFIAFSNYRKVHGGDPTKATECAERFVRYVYACVYVGTYTDRTPDASRQIQEKSESAPFNWTGLHFCLQRIKRIYNDGKRHWRHHRETVCVEERNDSSQWEIAEKLKFMKPRNAERCVWMSGDLWLMKVREGLLVVLFVRGKRGWIRFAESSRGDENIDT